MKPESYEILSNRMFLMIHNDLLNHFQILRYFNLESRLLCIFFKKLLDKKMITVYTVHIHGIHSIYSFCFIKKIEGTLEREV